MTTYLVTWTIEIDANSPREAAEAARAIQLRHDASAVVFDVDGQTVDLEATDESDEYYGAGESA